MLQKLRVHSKCRCDLTDPKHVKKDTVTSSVTKKLTRSECGGFNWKLHCFFWGEEAKIESRHVGTLLQQELYNYAIAF